MPNLSISDFDRFIAMDKKSIWVQVGVGAAILAIGTLALFGVLGAPTALTNDAIESVTKGGGLFVDLVGLVPFNNCWSRWERIQTLKILRDNPSSLDSAEIHGLVEKLYTKFLGV